MKMIVDTTQLRQNECGKVKSELYQNNMDREKQADTDRQIDGRTDGQTSRNMPRERER